MHIILVTKKKFNHMFQLGAGAGAEICPEPEKSKMTGSGNPHFFTLQVSFVKWLSSIQFINVHGGLNRECCTAVRNRRCHTAYCRHYTV